MENYEVTFIISALLPETEHLGIQNKVLQYIKDMEGQISKYPSSLGRKKLAYPIKKQKHGFYISLEFNLAAKSSLKDLDNKLKHNDNILRYLVIKKPVLTEKEVKMKEKKEENLEAKRKDTAEEIIKINLDDLDEKLDNLLD